MDHTPIVKSLRWPDETATQLFAAALAAQPALRDAFIELHGQRALKHDTRHGSRLGLATDGGEDGKVPR